MDVLSHHLHEEPFLSYSFPSSPPHLQPPLLAILRTLVFLVSIQRGFFFFNHSFDSFSSPGENEIFLKNNVNIVAFNNSLVLLLMVFSLEINTLLKKTKFYCSIVFLVFQSGKHSTEAKLLLVKDRIIWENVIFKNQNLFKFFSIYNLENSRVH